MICRSVPQTKSARHRLAVLTEPSPHAFPQFLRAIADVLPLTYFIRLVRDILLHGQQIWTQGTSVGVVAAWGAVGVIAAVRGFRWEPREA